MKVLLSIGGWTYSSNFAVPASTPQGRKKFAETAVGLVRDMGFDGLDIDWEYPQDDGQARNYVELLQACRAELDAEQRKVPQGHQHRPLHYLLTIAAPAGPQNYDKLHLKEMAYLLDFINLMAYDYAGSWDQTAGHQANFFPDQKTPQSTPFSTARALKDYVHRGVPPNKIVLGMPLYGRSFLATNGPGQAYSGTGEGSWERGVWDYKALPRPGAQEHYDKTLAASWSYDPETKEMVTYDTKPVAEQKVQLIKDWQLGGAMWWESSADKSGSDSLISMVYQGLEKCGKIEYRENELHYPGSKYENLKNGFKDEA
jgi:chitinase